MLFHSITITRRDFSSLCVAQSLSGVQLLVIPWTAMCQAPTSSTISWHLLKFMSIELMVLSKHLILCCPLLLLPLIFPSITVFSSKLALCVRWPKYWSLSISSSNKFSELISFRIDWFDFLAAQGNALLFILSRVFSSTMSWKHQFSGAQSSLWSNSNICTWILEKP